MITLKDFMEITEYRITGGNNSTAWYGFGMGIELEAFTDSGDAGVYIVIDPMTQDVLQLCAYDSTRNRSYRWVNTNDRAAFQKYVEDSGEAKDTIDLDEEEDILEKARAIMRGEEYDQRVLVPLTCSRDDLFKFMQAAHEMDVSLNEFVAFAIREAIAREQPKSPL